MSKYVREIDSIQQLRNTPTSDAAAAHVRTPTGQSGVFVPIKRDPFGRGDDGAVTVQASDGTWWVRRSVVENRTYNVRAFGAKGDGQTDDYGPIQEAINFAEQEGGRVVIPAGTYNVSETLITDTRRASLVGAGNEETVLRKTTNRKTGLPDSGDGITRDVDAVLMVDGGDTKAEANTLKGLSLRTSSPDPDQFGLYITSTFNSHIEDVHTRDVGTGIRAVQIFTTTVLGCQARDTIGDGFSFGSLDVPRTSTSLNIQSCFALRCGGNGYNVEGTKYSQITACAADGVGNWPYNLNTSNISLMNCGFEIPDESKGIRGLFGKYNIIGQTSGNVDPNSEGFKNQLTFTNSKVVIIGSVFDNYNTSGNSKNLILNGDTDLISLQTSYPENGSGFDIDEEATFNRIEGGKVFLDSQKVLEGRITNADLGNTPNTGDAATDDLISALVDVITTHGLGST